MDREPNWIWWEETRAIARRHARGASDAADDLAQELAVAALEAGGVERTGAWLERVGRNAVIDRWRLERRRHELAGEIAPPPAPPDPEARALLRERRGVLRRALAALPRPLRRAALARFHADLPFDAVASRLGTGPVTARTRVHRALAHLRARVSGLRALFAWVPGAQATVLGAALVVGVARPALFADPAARAEPARAPAVSVAHQRRVAQAARPAAAVRAAPAAAPAVRSASPRPAPARAEEPALPPPILQRFSFDDDEITSELARPDGIVLISEPAVGHLSLIELRTHFIPELVKSLEDL